MKVRFLFIIKKGLSIYSNLLLMLTIPKAFCIVPILKKITTASFSFSFIGFIIFILSSIVKSGKSNILLYYLLVLNLFQSFKKLNKCKVQNYLNILNREYHHPLIIDFLK